MMRTALLALCVTLLPIGTRAADRDLVKPPAGEPVKIGVMLCLTGACQEVGTNALRGVEMAQEELNAKGGILGRKVELAVQDTQEMKSPASAVSAYKQLRLDSAIKLFIGPTWSVGGGPLAPIIARDPGVIVTSPTLGVESFNEAAPNMFNVWPHDSVATKALAAYAIEHGLKRAAVVSTLTPWESEQARVFREEFKRLGGVETVFTETNPTENNLRPIAMKIKTSKPDMIFASIYTQLDLLGKALAEIKLALPMMTILLEETVVKNAAGTLDGIIYAAYEPATADFAARYLAKYKTPVGMGSDTGFDTLMIYAQAIVKAGSFEPEKVQPNLLATNYDGASGAIVFDDKGGVVKTPIFWHLKGSERKPLQN